MARKSKKAGKSKKASTRKRTSAARTAPIPRGMRTVTPYLVINGAAKAIEFYKKAFGAKEVRPRDAGRHLDACDDSNRRLVRDDVGRVSGWRYEVARLGRWDDLQPAHLLEGRRQALESGRRRGREGLDAARGPVLGRALWQTPGSVRPHLVRGDGREDERRGERGEAPSRVRDVREGRASRLRGIELSGI